MTMADVAREMAEGGTRVVVVVDDGRLIGIVTERDLVVRGLACRFAPDTPILAATTLNPVTVDVADPLSEADARLRKHGVRQLPVVEDGRVVGLLRLDDLGAPRAALAGCSS
jgi:CBS domain-containing protein